MRVLFAGRFARSAFLSFDRNQRDANEHLRNA